MTTSRQKILAYLAKSRTASVREISRSLKMSAPTVRHHLRVLSADGRVEMGAVRPGEGRGRPEKVFSLPRSALGDNLARLSDALLNQRGKGPGMESLASFLAGEYAAAGQPLAKRLNSTVDRLNEMNYHARWEAGPAGPRLLFGHCPYAALLARHPGLCRMDEALLRERVGQPVSQIQQIGKEGSSVCVFVTGR